MQTQAADVARVFHALGDPTRRAIFERLGERPHSVSGLATPLAVSLTAVMQHLQVLEDSGLVSTEKVGRVRTCRIEPGGFSVLEHWVGEQRAQWERRLDRLGDFLAEED
ncbi:MAG: metalloregulator ArsR/SmtB family transcription factor [Phenylobacterium sp.]